VALKQAGKDEGLAATVTSVGRPTTVLCVVEVSRAMAVVPCIKMSTSSA